MRRVLLVLALVIGLMVMGATSASAATFCSLDPTIGPLTFGATLGSTGLHIHLSLF